MEYVTEQFKAAIEGGVPLASDAIQLIATQISMYGVGLIIYSISYAVLLLIFSGTAFWYSRKCFQALNKGIQDRDSEGWTVAALVVSGLFSAITFIGTLIELSGLSDAIMMTTAPMVWAIQSLT